MADLYTWTATGSGDWGTASNWFDITAGTPATAAPGAADTAEIDNAGTSAITVTGPADVAGLSVSGQMTLAGSYDIGAFTVAGRPNVAFSSGSTSTVALAGTFIANSLSIGAVFFNPGFSTPATASALVEVDAGAMLSAGSLTLNAGDLHVDDGTAAISGGLTLGSDAFPLPSGEGFVLAGGSLDVTNHGSVQLGGLAITDGGVSLDATSTLEIGGAGTAAAGTITIDPGSVLTEGDANSYSDRDIQAAETADIGAPILNNGTISTDLNLSGVINNGTIFATNDTVRSINGDGLVEMIRGGTIGPGDSGTFDLGQGDSFGVALGTGVPIDPTDTPAIANFAASDTTEALVLQGITADIAIYTPTGPGTGTLTLYDDTTPVASLTMLGTYANDAFAVVPESGDSVLSLNTVAVTNSYTWIVAGSGDWGSASNWFDATTGTPTAVPPGPNDIAEIDNTGTAPITVTGPADVSSLLVSGDVTLAGSYTVNAFTLGVPPAADLVGDTSPTSTIALAGTFDAGSLRIGFAAGGALVGLPPSIPDIGIVRVGEGAMLSAGSVVLNAGELSVDGGSANVTGALDLGTVAFYLGGLTESAVATGTLDVTNHAILDVGELIVADGGINLDATSTLDVGSAGTAAAGTITVDPNAVLQLTHFGSLAAGGASGPPILNNGTIDAAADLSNVINNGTIYVGDTALNDVTLWSIGGNGQIDVAGNRDIGVGGITIGPDVSGTLALNIDRTESITIALGTGVPIDGTDTPGFANFGTGVSGVSDSIILQGISADTATYTATGPGIGTLTLDDGATPVASLTMLGTYAANAFTVTPGSGDSTVSLTVPCFAAGTRIATPRGDVVVEALAVGDEVALAHGGSAPIVWIGRRRVDCQTHPTPHDVWPVRIRRDAFGIGIPCRDVFLSPDHAIFADGVLIPVKYLMNGDTIRQVRRKTVTYFHVELPAHDVLLAEGLPVESYLDTGDRNSFENGGRVVALFPSFGSLVRDAYGYAPLVVTGPQLDAVRRRIVRGDTPRRQRRRNSA